MLSLPVFPDSHLLTHSSESTWKICNRKYFFRNVLGLKPIHSANALRKGTAIHLGLEAFKQGKPLAEAEANLRALYAKSEPPPWLEPLEYQVEIETAIAIVRAYYRRYWNDGIMEFVAQEVTFDLPIRYPGNGMVHPHYHNAGKIDGIARLPDGRLALVEHKTTSDNIGPESEYWGSLLMDSQISRYFLAAREMGYDVETTIYDVIRKPAIKPSNISKANRAQANYDKEYHGLALTYPCPERETPELFAARVEYDMAVERPDWYFQRKEISRLTADLEAYRNEQWVMATMLDEAMGRTAYFGESAYPRNTKSCTLYGTCEYFNTCRGMTGNPIEQVPEGFQRATTLHSELTNEIEEEKEEAVG